MTLQRAGCDRTLQLTSCVFLGRSLHFPFLGLRGQIQELFPKLAVHIKRLPGQRLLLALLILLLEHPDPRNNRLVLGRSHPLLYREADTGFS